jgi:quinohemoprotein ethanol dehydrogenase
MPRQAHAQFNDIVLGGIRKDAGMAGFKDILLPEDVEKIHAYLTGRAQEEFNNAVITAH